MANTENKVKLAKLNQYKSDALKLFTDYCHKHWIDKPNVDQRNECKHFFVNSMITTSIDKKSNMIKMI